MPIHESLRAHVPDAAARFFAEATVLTGETLSDVLPLPRGGPLTSAKLIGDTILVNVRVAACNGSCLIEAQVGDDDEGDGAMTVAALTVTLPGDYVIPVEVLAVERLVATGPTYLNLNVTPGASVTLGADIQHVR
jgi:hypothetical protein